MGAPCPLKIIIMAVTVIFLLDVGNKKSSPRGVAGQTYDDAKNLSDTLLTASRYRRDVRPQLNQSEAIKVEIIFELVSIVEVDDVTKKFECNSFVGVSWTDEILTWNPSSHGGIPLIHPHPVDIWRPRILILNTLEERDLFEDDASPVSIYPNGEVVWAPGGLFKVSCDMNLLKYPFDTQECFIHMMPISYQVNELIYTTPPGYSGLTFYSPNGEWDLTNLVITVGQQSISNQSYASCKVNFSIARRPTFFVLNILLPVVLLSLLNMLVFTIPADSGEKVSYGITVLLAMSVFLSIVSSMLPKSSDVVPRVTIYLFILLIVSVLTVIDAIIIVLFSHMEEKEDKANPVLKETKTIKAKQRFTGTKNKINVLRRALVGMRAMAKVAPPSAAESGEVTPSVLEGPPLPPNSRPFSSSSIRTRLFQAARTPQVNGDLPGSDQQKKQDQDNINDRNEEKANDNDSEEKGENKSPSVNKYKVIGKYIDAVSLIAFLLVWFIVTLWYCISVLS